MNGIGEYWLIDTVDRDNNKDYSVKLQARFEEVSIIY